MRWMIDPRGSSKVEVGVGGGGLDGAGGYITQLRLVDSFGLSRSDETRGAEAGANYRQPLLRVIDRKTGREP